MDATQHEQTAALAAKIEERHNIWERGEATSPSHNDFVHDATEVFGVKVDSPTFDDVAERLYEVDCEQSLTADAMAKWLFDEFVGS